MLSAKAAGRETQPGLPKRDLSLLSVFEAGNGHRPRWRPVPPASGRLQGWLNLRPTARPSRDRLLLRTRWRGAEKAGEGVGKGDEGNDEGKARNERREEEGYLISTEGQQGASGWQCSPVHRRWPLYISGC